MKVVTCGNCGKSWDESRDPAPAALCHWCHGRGHSTAEVLNCGHEPTPQKKGSLGTGAAVFNGQTMCYDCAAASIKTGALADGRFTAYVSSDGTKITTWDGQEIGIVRRRTVSGYKAWYQVTAYGKAWYGQGPSESGTYVSLRQYKGE